MIRKTFAAALLASAALFTALPASAQEDQTFNAKQTDAVRKIVRDYLMEHPEVIGEAIEALREKMKAQAESDAKKAIESRKDEILNAADDPVSGNAAGDVVVVEFFDYNCPYCKVVLDPMMEAAKADGKVKVVFKEMPILSEESLTAARVALAAKKQGKYDEVHRAFMKFRGKLDDKAIFRLAGEAGANVDQIKKEMMAPEIEKQIRKNIDLAHALDISSTPSFVVAGKDGKAARILAGAIEGPVFKQLFDITRKGGRLSGAN
ncbi:DsbA family protein [Magnetospirillum moscoviense]|uniref:Protein-disulfide isomerase n=1 Tax=Magnetospirillum moscoviense TaxID=1437059 RepID=A0A178MQW3_9PROT|nr:DsbA family protein [Magnetospirillum moscoviense]MBF0323515.1 DsbA family protein [Alphaproteobacteria bacterium]OAN50903.1 protein-disulfide isomerase [Magnetospirillum moscoviense]